MEESQDRKGGRQNEGGRGSVPQCPLLLLFPLTSPQFCSRKRAGTELRRHMRQVEGFPRVRERDTTYSSCPSILGFSSVGAAASVGVDSMLSPSLCAFE